MLTKFGNEQCTGCNGFNGFNRSREEGNGFNRFNGGREEVGGKMKDGNYL